MCFTCFINICIYKSIFPVACVQGKWPPLRTTSYPSGKTWQLSLRDPRFDLASPFPRRCEFVSLFTCASYYSLHGLAWVWGLYILEDGPAKAFLVGLFNRWVGLGLGLGGREPKAQPKY